MRTHHPALVVLLCGIAAAACQENADPPPPDRDLSTDTDVITDTYTVEDGSDVDEEEVTEECMATLGTWEPYEQRAGVDDLAGRAWKMEGTVDGSFYTSPLNELNIESWYEYGGPSTPGTYDLSGWTNALMCGICAYYFDNCEVVDDSSTCERIYAASEGEVDLDILEPTVDGVIRGTLTGVYMVQVHFGNGYIIEDGWNFCLDYWEFTATFDPISWW